MTKLDDMKEFNLDHIGLGTAHLYNSKLSNKEANIKLKLDEVSEFPVHVFPPFIQDVIIEAYENLSYNVDYIASAILTALAGTIGNSYKLKVNIEWIENSSLWIVLVGKSGQNKSAPIKTAFKAMTIQQNQYDDLYKEAVDNYDPDSGCKKPLRKKLYSTDPTFEALIKIHKDNSNGITLRPDEFKSFINNLTAYSGSSKQSNYLSIWDGAPISMDRKETESTSIKNPCISIIGGIQDDIIAGLKAKDIKDGFFERLLFVIPIKMEKRPILETNVEEHIIEVFHSKMKKLLIKIESDATEITIGMSAEAYEMFTIERNKHVEPSNKDASISGILSKLDRYILRFALILEVSTCIFEKKPIVQVSQSSMKRAIMLKDYFFANALKLNRMVLNVFEDNSKEGKVFQVLKKIGKREFTNKEFIEMANKLNIAKESYAYQLLSNTKLAHKVQKGVYETDAFN